MQEKRDLCEGTAFQPEEPEEPGEPGIVRRPKNAPKKSLLAASPIGRAHFSYTPIVSKHPFSFACSFCPRMIRSERRGQR